MAVEKDIEAGNKLRDDCNFEEAIVHYDKALKENPQAFKAHYEKAIALQRMKKYDEALASLYQAQIIAIARGKRDLVAAVLFRYAVLYYNKGEYETAIKFLNTSNFYGHDKTDITVWKNQIDFQAKNLNLKLDRSLKFNSLDELPTIDLSKTLENKTQTPSTSAEAAATSEANAIESNDQEKRELEEKMKNKNRIYPKVKDIKRDWYQSTDNVTVSIFIKNLPRDDSLKVDINKKGFRIEFPTSESSEFQYEVSPLFEAIDPNESSFQVYSTKIEFFLKKAVTCKWKSLESTEHEPETVFSLLSSNSSESKPLQYPSSYQKHVDWNTLKYDEDDDDMGENAFFRHLYKDSDDDTKRAMMKSYVESNGTVLSTNWDEVSKKKFETSPPDGLEAKTWS